MVTSDDNDDRQRVNDFFSILNQKLIIHRQTKLHLDRFLSTDFNVFAWIKPDEKRLSKIISNLLNPACSHGQQHVFLDAFLRRIGKNDLCDKQALQVATEYRIENPEGWIDVLVNFGTFVIAIENKPWAKEGHEQVDKYSNYLNKKYDDQFCLIYLTPSGEEPGSIDRDKRERLTKEDKLLCISYHSHILEWLRECCQLCKSNKFREFLRDFMDYIPTMEGEMSNSSDREIIVEHALKNKENLENAVEVYLAYDELDKRISEGFWRDLCSDLQRCFEKHLDMSQWEFIPEEEFCGFAKREWEGKYKIGMQLYKKTVLLGVYKKELDEELIEGLAEAIKVEMKKGQQGERDDWWEYYFELELFGPKALVEMQFSRPAIKEKVCKELVKISKIRQAMHLIDKHVKGLKS